jgi:hypothetical protein
MTAGFWLTFFSLVAVTAVLFYGGKRFIFTRDKDALRRFYEKPALPLAIMAVLIVVLLTLAVLPLLSLGR